MGALMQRVACIPCDLNRLAGHSNADRVITGGAARIACRGSGLLGRPGSIHCPDLQYVLPLMPRLPVCLPKDPGEARQRSSEVGSQPGPARIGAVLDLADTSGTCKRHPEEADRFPGIRDVAVLRYVESRRGFDQ